MSELRLEQENVVFHGTGGRSQENRSSGFLPAFFDVQRSFKATQQIGPAPAS